MAQTVLDVPQNVFIEQYAKKLKEQGQYKVPKWAIFVKTGFSRQLAPQCPDWFYVKGAAILRRLYCQESIGVTGFTKIFGKARDGTTSINHFQRASGAVIKKALKQLENLKLVEKIENGGRKLTDKGRKELDQFAKSIKL